MTDDEEREIVVAMREAMKKARGYANYFGWAANRDLEEWGVMQCLRESLESQGQPFCYLNLTIRGRPNDPPDFEARDADGRRVAVEVTELVSEEAIRAHKTGSVYDFAVWDRGALVSNLTRTIARKDGKYPQLKDPPYDGGYELVVFTDEPMLSRESVEKFLSGHVFEATHLSRVMLLLGYDPGVQRCPLYKLPLHA
jgi:hypothetical protein